jgi:hypothetical protein
VNRRHKFILFTSLVATGSALLAGTELKTALGMLMIGGAVALAVGSDLAANFYSTLKAAKSRFWLWIRIPLIMIFAGAVLGITLLLSDGNPVAAVCTVAVIGVLAAPLLAPPTKKKWVRVLSYTSALALFAAASLATLVADSSASDQHGGRFGEIVGECCVVLLFAVFWFSNGWVLIQEGINIDVNALEISQVQGRTGRRYLSLCIGIAFLTFWSSILLFNASGDWSYNPWPTKPSQPNTNIWGLGMTLAFVSWWPYASWKGILSREPNSEPRFLRKHKRTTAAVGLIVVAALCLAVTFGVQNGTDRKIVDQINQSSSEMEDIAAKLGALKQRRIETTQDYIQTYSEIDELIPALDTTVNHAEEVLKRINRVNESRGSFNIQHLYLNRRPEAWTNYSDAIELVRQMSTLTKKETSTIKSMSQLPIQDQPQFWQTEFKPLLGQENSLRQQALKIQSANAK